MTGMTTGDGLCAALIVARLGSSRLPRKHLSIIRDKPSIVHVIERVRQAKLIDRIVLCTTVRPEDLELVEVARREGIDHFQGNEHNMLQRFYDAARHYGIEFSVIVEGDEAFCDWELMDSMVRRYRESSIDYVNVKGVPLGSYLHGIRTSALGRVCDVLDESWETDGWGRYFTDPELFSFRTDTLVVDDPLMDQPGARMTLDWPEDLALIQEVYDRLSAPGKVISLGEVMELLHREPGLMSINAELVDKYRDRVANFGPLRMKGRGVTS